MSLLRRAPRLLRFPASRPVAPLVRCRFFSVESDKFTGAQARNPTKRDADTAQPPDRKQAQSAETPPNAKAMGMDHEQGKKATARPASSDETQRGMPSDNLKPPMTAGSGAQTTSSTHIGSASNDRSRPAGTPSSPSTPNQPARQQFSPSSTSDSGTGSQRPTGLEGHTVRSGSGSTSGAGVVGEAGMPRSPSDSAKEAMGQGGIGVTGPDAASAMHVQSAREHEGGVRRPETDASGAMKQTTATQAAAAGFGHSKPQGAAQNDAGHSQQNLNKSAPGDAPHPSSQQQQTQTASSGSGSAAGSEERGWSEKLKEKGQELKSKVKSALDENASKMMRGQ